MPIAGSDNTGTTSTAISEKQLITNNDEQPINFDNNIIVDGYGGSYIDNYIKYIDGLNLEVDYFSFIRGTSGENTLLDISDTTQQYIQVKQLLLKITSAIPDGVNYTGISLDGILDANIVPAENDLAMVRLPSGLVGIFKISINDNRSYITKKIYDIKLTFLYFKKDNIDYYNNLMSKVKKVYVYDKSFITSNSAPIILESTYRHKIEVRNTYTELLNQYLKLFTYDKVLSVMLNKRLFDVNIQNIIIPMLEGVEYTTLKVVESDSNNINVVTSILKKNKKLDGLNRYYELVNVVYDIALAHTISLISGSVDMVVHTTNINTTIIPDGGTASTIIPNNYRTGTTNLYLFSNAFYDGFDGLEELSLLETSLSRYMDNEIIPFEDIMLIVNDISNWSTLEQYNYIPFVLILLNYFNLNTYDRM
jgi:hypothetical protein